MAIVVSSAQIKFVLFNSGISRKGDKMSDCEHYWNYEHTVYAGNTIRRWCSECGLIQHASAKHWATSKIGLNEKGGEYPDGYPEKFREEKD